MKIVETFTLFLCMGLQLCLAAFGDYYIQTVISFCIISIFRRRTGLGFFLFHHALFLSGKYLYVGAILHHLNYSTAMNTCVSIMI